MSDWVSYYRSEGPEEEEEQDEEGAEAVGKGSSAIPGGRPGPAPLGGQRVEWAAAKAVPLPVP